MSAAGGTLAGMPMDARRASLFRLGLVLLFALLCPQQPLYSSNQNTYLLHGLAEAGAGHLSGDWLAQTLDPFPLFSALVTFVLRHAGEDTIYFLQFAMQMIYIHSLLGITAAVVRRNDMGAAYLAHYGWLLLLYSGALTFFMMAIPPLRGLAELPLMLNYGVAGQKVLGVIFQPSVFGVFVLSSIHAFLSGRRYLAMFCLAIASAFHSTYLLAAAVLAVTYLGIVGLGEGNVRLALRLGATGLVLVLPVVIRDVIVFAPSGAGVFARAEDILVHQRIPQHVVVGVWFGGKAIVKVIIVVAALYLTRRTRLFPILLVPFLAAIVLTLVQLVTGSLSLALMSPWRLSVFLVPVASSIVAAAFIAWLFRHAADRLAQLDGPHGLLRRLQRPVVMLVFILLAGLGLRQALHLLDRPRTGVSAMTRFIAASYRPGDLYLIPPNQGDFRIAAGVPVLVDWKSHPLKDVEVLEWHERNMRASAFYDASGSEACRLLAGLREKYGVTHVVARQAVTGCASLRQIRHGEGWTLYKLDA